MKKVIGWLILIILASVFLSSIYLISGLWVLIEFLIVFGIAIVLSAIIVFAIKLIVESK